MIVLGHGAGGRLSQQLIREHFVGQLNSPVLSMLEDSGVIGDLALTTDAYVVSPRFFAGGDLGRLAISGTVNDLCMVGANPLGLSAAFILEEGFAIDELDRLVASMASTAEEAGVPVITGDTKVVPRGACDGAFIATSGIGRVEPAFRPSPAKARPGDAVVVSGTVADHGVAVMASREGIGLQGDLASDVAPLGSLVDALRQAQLEVHAMRDPTRGGMAQALIEMASQAGIGISLDEASIPIRSAVRAACQLLGLDPLYVANEGKLLLLLPEEQASAALEVMRSHPLGRRAEVIGRTHGEGPGVQLRTAAGGMRRLRMLSGEQLPRIC